MSAFEVRGVRILGFLDFEVRDLGLRVRGSGCLRNYGSALDTGCHRGEGLLRFRIGI